MVGTPEEASTVLASGPPSEVLESAWASEVLASLPASGGLASTPASSPPEVASHSMATVSDPVPGHEAPPFEIAAVTVTLSLPGLVQLKTFEVPVVSVSDPAAPVAVHVSVTSED